MISCSYHTVNAGASLRQRGFPKGARKLPFDLEPAQQLPEARASCSIWSDVLRCARPVLRDAVNRVARSRHSASRRRPQLAGPSRPMSQPFSIRRETAYERATAAIRKRMAIARRAPEPPGRYTGQPAAGVEQGRLLTLQSSPRASAFADRRSRNAWPNFPSNGSRFNLVQPPFVSLGRQRLAASVIDSPAALPRIQPTLAAIPAESLVAGHPLVGDDRGAQ